MDAQRRHYGSYGFQPRTTPLEAQFPSLDRRFDNQPLASTDFLSLESAFSNLNISPNNNYLLGCQDGSFNGSGSVEDSSFLGDHVINDWKVPVRDLSDQERHSLCYTNTGYRDYTIPSYSGDLLDIFGMGGLNIEDPVRYGLRSIGSTTTMGSLSRGDQGLVRSSNQRVPLWVQEPAWSFDSLSGRILGLAKDQYGCRLLQRLIGGLTSEQIDMVFQEVIDFVGELMLDPFGNYVVQRLVEVCRKEQRTRILLNITKKEFQLVGICLNMHGTRAVQKLLAYITTPEQVSIVMSALRRGAVALTKDANGHHVIQHCLKHFSAEDNKYLLTEVADNCFTIATDKSGCCVLQLCVQYSQGEHRDRLVAEIIAHALLLSEDRYGNYVVQHIVGLKVPSITARLLTQLQGNFAALSCNNYGSNVVEKFLESSEDQSTWIIMELLSSPDASLLLRDPFGNYVIQRALTVSKGQAHLLLRGLVHMNIPMLRSNIYGRKVLAWFEKRNLYT